MKYSLNKRKSLLDSVLFLDGLGRAGKFLLGKVVSNFQRVEYFQYVTILEHIPILSHLGCMERNAAIAFLQLNTDLNIYDQAVGRNLNLRNSDYSCIRNATDYKDYIHRIEEQDGPEAIEKLKINKRIPSFLIHDCLSHIELFVEAFPNLLMINIQRHPVDIAHSWFLRGWGDRFGEDSLAFIPTIRGERLNVPWFAAKWQSQYERMEPVDRIIKSICTLSQLEFTAFNKLTNQKNLILQISYESFFSNPNKIVKQISHFLNSEPLPNMDKVLRREGCPKKIPLNKRMKKFNELKGLSNSDELIDELVSISYQYEKFWEIPRAF